MRYGNDFAAVPLNATSTLADCGALCCASAECAAFSYNNPQPSKACSGGSECCLEGGVCCMLKDSAGTLSNNTYGPAVRTGTAVKPTPSAAPGPTPPFPPSTAITGVVFGEPRWWSGSGDTWVNAWSANGSTYGWACDSNNGAGESPMSLWRIVGDPYSNVTAPLQPQLVANTPIDYQALCAHVRTDANVKPAGMMALPSGELITGISCMNYGDDPAFNRQHNLVGFLASSADGGVTWTNSTPVDAFPGRFATPVPVSCGQANAPCSAKDGAYTYVFFPGAFDDASYWDNNDFVMLARVPLASVSAPAAYEYFTGLDGSGAPTWAADAAEAQPTFVFDRMIGANNGVVYNPFLGRYLIANPGFIDAEGHPVAWHSAQALPHRTQLTFLESPTPWGPWSLFFRSDSPSSLALGLYGTSFPSAYMRPVNGSTAEMVLFFACLQGAANCRYTLNYVTVTLTLAPELALP